MTRPGPQRAAGGELLRQVEPTTCGPSVLLATAALVAGNWPAAVGVSPGRFGAAQRRVHRQAGRIWPRALGTTPFAMCAWLHRHVPAAGRFRIRWTPGAPRSTVLRAVTRAVSAGRPVPLMVGSRIPRHWVLVTGADRDGWWVYEPSSGEVQQLEPGALGSATAASSLGWPRLHAVLVPGT